MCLHSLPRAADRFLQPPFDAPMLAWVDIGIVAAHAIEGLPHTKQRGGNTLHSGLIGNHKHLAIPRSLAMSLPIHRKIELFRAL